jgi:hypothetical protein
MGAVLVCCACAWGCAPAASGGRHAPSPAEVGRRFETLRVLDAPEARQAVAVGERFFYAIGNRTIAKYDKHSGERVLVWSGREGGPIIHLNSGVVLGERLYAAHSNYPAVPMISSIEVFDAATLAHVGSHGFGVFAGSATWVDRHDDRWWVAFANYEGRGGTPGQGPEATTLVAFDDAWRPLASHTFPAAVVERFGSHSNSGGAWGPDGYLYITGHDAPEVYVVRLPRTGPVLELVEIVPVHAEGQGIAWDVGDPGTLYSISRSQGKVIVSRLLDAENRGGRFEGM